MAWPFKKSKLTAPKPQAPKHVVHKKIHVVHEAITQDTKMLAKDVEHVLKHETKLEKEFDEHREQIVGELKSINKNMGPLYDADTKLETNVKELNLMDKKLLSEINRVERKVKDAKDIIQNVEDAYNTETIKKLKAHLIEATNSAKIIENSDFSILKKLQTIDRRIGIIERHANRINEEKLSMKESAEELARHASDLKGTIGGYSDQFVELSGKVSANIAKTADIDAEVHAILSRLQTSESQLAVVADISRAMQEQSQLLTKIARRLEYLEKITVKTVVLD